MPHVITSITLQKKNRDRFNVFINDKYSFSLNRTLASGLKSGDHLTHNQIEALKKTDEEDSAYARAIFYLKFRPRTRMEINRYLTGKQFSAAAVTSALSRLEADGYINDHEFARLWIENRLRLKPKGCYALSAELREKGIREGVIADYLKDVNETKMAWKAALPKLDRLKKLEKTEFKKKLYDFLTRRGFDYSVCREICDQAWEENDAK